MIRVIGLSDDVYNHILTYHDRLVKRYSDKSHMIEFIPQCTLELNYGSVSIEYNGESAKFICCDYWRIEIE